MITLNDIDEQSYVSEMEVMDSMIALYTKEAQMLCYVSDDVVQECLYQEGAKWDKFKDDVNAGIKGKQGEGILKKILLFIPRLIASFVKWIKNIFTKNVSNTASDTQDAMRTAKSLDDEESEVVELVAEVVEENYENDELIDAMVEEIRQQREEMNASFIKAAQTTQQNLDMVNSMREQIRNRHNEANKRITDMENNQKENSEKNKKTLDDIKHTNAEIDKELSKINELLDGIDVDRNAVANAVQQVAKFKRSSKTYKLSQGGIKYDNDVMIRTGLEEQDFLVRVTKALHNEEVYCGFDISACISLLTRYESFLADFQDAVHDYKSGDQELFLKKISDIRSKYYGNGNAEHISSLKDISVSKHGIENSLGDIYRNSTAGSKVSFNVFTSDMHEILEKSKTMCAKCEDIVDIFTEISNRYEAENKDNADKYEAALNKLDVAAKRIDPSEYISKKDKLKHDYYDSESFQKSANADSGLFIIRRIQDSVRLMNVAVDHYHREVLCYNKIAKAVKSKKAIKMRKR